MPLTSAITIDRIPKTAQSRMVTITGRNAATIATIVISGVTATVLQPTATIWKAEIRLSPGDNEIKISGIDLGGNVSESLTFTITLQELDQELFMVENVFDEFGLLEGLPRLPGEKNLPYRQRIQDVEVRKADTTVIGLVHGASRDLGIRMQIQLGIRSPLDGNVGGTRLIDGAIRIGSVYLDVLSSRFRVRDCLRVESATQKVTLSQRPTGKDVVSIVTLEGDRIDPRDFEIDFHEQEVHFLTHKLNGVYVYVSYPYIERISLRDRTIRDIADDLLALVDLDGQPLLELIFPLDPNYTPAENLIPTMVFVPVDQNFVGFDVSAVRIRELHDLDYRDSLLNDQDHAIGTRLEAYAQNINMNARVTWNSVFLGKSVWEPLGEDPKLGTLPHLFDAARGHWRCLSPADDTRFTIKDYRAYNGVCPNDGTALKYRGVLPNQFQSGTGTQNDCKVTKIVAVQGG